MKFIFADSLDYVDPNYIFEEDRSAPSREPYWDDLFPHEILDTSPYDGILVSRSVIGSHRFPGKYSEAQAMRFRRVGAREFLRFREEDYPGSAVFGDSGAFAYHKRQNPPYTAEEMVDFYADGGFTHGCSVDHIIFDFADDDRVSDIEQQQQEENIRRFELTLENAEDFLDHCKRLGNKLTPLGVIQGWSPGSMAQAALRLQRMGYSYLAVGGMAPLRSAQIIKALKSIRRAVGDRIRLHLLGFAKAEEIADFADFKITSFDSTSPLLRAFKDSRSNYYVFKKTGGLDYFSAIRIPQSTQNNNLINLAKQGVYGQEDLQRREQSALDALRAFDREELGKDEALDAIMAYTAPLAIGRDKGHSPAEKTKLTTLRERYDRTLTHSPWKNCSCAICRKVGVEVIIFRASNRNKRRGIHNLQAYRQHIQRIEELKTNGEDLELQSHPSAAELPA